MLPLRLITMEWLGRQRSLVNSLLLSLKITLIGIVGVILKRLQPMQEVGTDGEVLVLANGPSLTTDLPLIDTSVYANVFAVNDFASSSLFPAVRPSEYFMQDPFWFEPRSQMSAATLATVEALANDTKWPMKLYFPAHYWNSETILRLQTSSFITLKPLPQHNWPDFHALLSEYDTLHHLRGNHKTRLFRIWADSRAQFLTNGVIQSLLFELIRSGAERVDLVGLDMSMAREMGLDATRQPRFTPTHFYAPEGAAKSNAAGLGATMAGAYRGVAQKFELFYLLEEFAKYVRVPIVNLSSDSLLDAFLPSDS